MDREFEYQWGQLVARAWADPAFKARLIADPAGVLKEHGITPPPGVEISLLENTEKVMHLTLPPGPPSDGTASS